MLVLRFTTEGMAFSIARTTGVFRSAISFFSGSDPSDAGRFALFRETKKKKTKTRKRITVICKKILDFS